MLRRVRSTNDEASVVENRGTGWNQVLLWGQRFVVLMNHTAAIGWHIPALARVPIKTKARFRSRTGENGEVFF